MNDAGSRGSPTLRRDVLRTPARRSGHDRADTRRSPAGPRRGMAVASNRHRRLSAVRDACGGVAARVARSHAPGLRRRVAGVPRVGRRVVPPHEPRARRVLASPVRRPCARHRARVRRPHRAGHRGGQPDVPAVQPQQRGLRGIQRDGRRRAWSKISTRRRSGSRRSSANLHDDQWDRTLVRDGGKDGVFTFTVQGQACYALHESHHHLLDANGTLPVGGAPA